MSVCGSTLIHDDVVERARQRPTWNVFDVHQYGNSIATVVTTVVMGTVSKKSFFKTNIMTGEELFERNECSRVYIGKRTLACSLPRYDRANSCIQWIHIKREREGERERCEQQLTILPFSSVGKQRSNANVSICTNDIQSVCYGYLHTYQCIPINNHERREARFSHSEQIDHLFVPSFLSSQ